MITKNRMIRCYHEVLTAVAVVFMICSSAPIQAKIDEVTITWTPQLCLYSCAAELNNRFLKIPGVAEVDLNQPAGRAKLKWEPESPFTYAPINAAMSWIGLSIIELRIKVSGYIVHDEKSVTLVSKPDGTRFVLKSPTNPIYNQYVEQFNIYGYSMNAQMRDELLEAEENKLEVEITGQIFEPERSPPLVLIIERKQIVKKKPEEKSKQRR